MLSLLLGLLLAVQASAAPQQRNDTRTWYQAYADAQQNVARGNWQAALNDLDAASRRGAPAPGRNVLFYGDVYRDYNPDYYRGLAYVNLQRYDEANQAFTRVRQAQLIASRDALYAEFTRQSNVAMQNLGKAPPDRQAPPVDVAQAPVQVSPAQVPPTAGQNAAIVPPGARGIAPSPAGGTIPSAAAGNAPPPANTTTLPSVPAGNASASVRPPEPRPTPPVRATTQARTTAATTIRPPAPVVPSAVPVNERTGVLQFFSGDYEAAASSLASVIDNAASPRAYFYLACARAALVLTGKAPKSEMDGARAQLALAKGTGQFAPDLRLISPRIRRELGIEP